MQSLMRVVGALLRWCLPLTASPYRLVAWGVGLSILIVGQAMFLSGSVSDLWQTVQTIGRDSTPSILTAEQIRVRFADMETSAANAFLSNDARADASWKQFDDDRLAVDQLLVDAAYNIAYGNAEYQPIQTMTASFQDYIIKIDKARAKGTADFTDLKAASDIVRQTLLPSAEALDGANLGPLNVAYRTFSNNLDKRVEIMFLYGGALLFALLVLQVRLTHATRRLVNPPLLLATLVIGGMTAYLVVIALSVAANIKTVKLDAFDSIHALSKAEATASLANADESLWLLSDAADKVAYDASLQANIAAVAANQDGTALKSSDVETMVTRKGDGYQGFLAEEIRNITFDGEQAAAIDSLRKWTQYVEIINNISALEHSGRHADAVALRLDGAHGQTDWAFEQFYQAVKETLSINQKAFDDAVVVAFKILDPVSELVSASAVAAVVLVWFGLGLRLREYW